MGPFDIRFVDAVVFGAVIFGLDVEVEHAARMLPRTRAAPSLTPIFKRLIEFPSPIPPSSRH
jgi:hypothetical protein